MRERIRARGSDPDELPADTLLQPDSVGSVYWQTRDAWTHELDVRPFAETW